MEGIYCSLIICCPASGNEAAEIFPTEEGGNTNGLMVRISVMLSVWLYSGGNSAVAR